MILPSIILGLVVVYVVVSKVLARKVGRITPQILRALRHGGWLTTEALTSTIGHGRLITMTTIERMKSDGLVAEAPRYPGRQRKFMLTFRGKAAMAKLTDAA